MPSGLGRPRSLLRHRAWAPCSENTDRDRGCTQLAAANVSVGLLQGLKLVRVRSNGERLERDEKIAKSAPLRCALVEGLRLVRDWGPEEEDTAGSTLWVEDWDNDKVNQRISRLYHRCNLSLILPRRNTLQVDDEFAQKLKAELAKKDAEKAAAASAPGEDV